MPKGKSTWGTLFKRGERTSHEVRQILDSPIDPTVPFSAQLKRIYEACMDMDEINEKGARPAQKYIKARFLKVLFRYYVTLYKKAANFPRKLIFALPYLW